MFASISVDASFLKGFAQHAEQKTRRRRTHERAHNKQETDEDDEESSNMQNNRITRFGSNHVLRTFMLLYECMWY